MKSILGVVGSPRRNGNTHVVVSRVLEAAERQGAAVESLFLADLTIAECDGCHVCWDGKQCAKNDDMNAVYPKLIESDVIVFGTPVYWYGPTALMKAFVDRLVYFNCPENGAKIRGKSAAVVVPFEEKDPEAAAPVVAFFQKCLDYLEMDLVGRLLVPGVTRRGEVLEKPETLRKASELGTELA